MARIGLARVRGLQRDSEQYQLLVGEPTSRSVIEREPDAEVVDEVRAAIRWVLDDLDGDERLRLRDAIDVELERRRLLDAGERE